MPIIFTSPGPMLVQLGSFFIRWYSLSIALAILLGLYLSPKLACQRRVNPVIVSDILPVMVVVSILFARIYYIIFQWDYYCDHWSEILAVWKGGIAIHGALIGSTLTVAVFSYRKNHSFLTLTDILVPSIAMGQAIGRWGNFFNSEAFGLPTSSFLKIAIPYNSRQSLFINQQFFHPTFLYESCWDLSICLLLLVLFHRISQGKIYLRDGTLTCFYLISYGLGRFWIEGIRSDPLCLLGNAPLCENGLRMAQVMSLTMIALGTFCLLKMVKSYITSDGLHKSPIKFY
uniref:Prolipoprotein diacylglyceryl transferase n=1 Tax=Paulinella micropora TaxID=1928728 RepID=A0A385I160_9EUKA|nr:prolipoprotein diacylglyceryl transferase [Paulinella micropora]AXY63663.1 prolipoprotein diacylglyceryl transferase [Paulinella micropora]